MIKKPRRPAKPAENPYLTSGSADELSPANRIAYEIVAERRDLVPSVERIMNAGLDQDATVRALSLFRESLTAIGDPHRDPRVAIAAVTSSSTATGVVREP
jgi:hypothetical protein